MNEHYKQATRILEGLAHARHIRDVFRDFVEAIALMLRNAVDRRGWDEREARYLEVVKPYKREELERFAELFALVTMIMESEPQDVLGRLYMQLETGNERLGQFFTPYDIAKLIAAMTVKDTLERDPKIVRLHEPACGAGAFLIAFADQLRTGGINPQQRLHVDAEDLDLTAVHMTYIHLTLLHVPARVAHRNTLTQETWDVWPTPAHVMGGWWRRLANTAAADLMTVDAPPLPTGDPIQGGLFDLQGATT